ncbi:MAG: 4-alpha-glucanotransferase [Methylovulum sp.]|uniref:4-alpha-glucanotransferase n=1 Tax=Methylovulum sp. TaxID=1916980 RepID=UPI002602F5B6|nr:4-alpha-glucanotransferase [Methylovulum sp.]MDD2723375.1 4-alpha-glucanotransferase [Methylovulum sp.]MDD5124258.1 4-alpha-glucanotransferase [Methylovulum sp.]
MKPSENDLLNKRRAGILLHVTSLPGPNRTGDLGQDAYYFVDFLHKAGVTVWQTLPLGMTHADGSPYQCLSAHAGNPDLINIDWLITQGWLQLTDKCQDCQGSEKFNKSCLINKAYQGFLKRANQTDKDDFAKFCQDKAFWLDDFALFLALRVEFNNQSWSQWPGHLKERDSKAIKEARCRLVHAIDSIKFEQYVFFRQWMALKAYANAKGVLLFGDIPIFVSYDSADVWANRDVFKLNDNGDMLVVAGVPPDYFSETGQRWGNPHYNWTFLKKTGFNWWLERMHTQLEQFDILRIDHFRGLEAAWEIPAHEPTAKQGEWVKAPGKALLNAIKADLGAIPLVAEDLGIITNEVIELRDEFHLPGMKILHFAFGGGPDNPYLPNNYEKNCVVYTGTHDNDTSLGWVGQLSENEKKHVYEYLGNPVASLQCALIQAALASVANLAIIPMQDILELGSEHRMNTPGTTVGNWQWRFQWEQLTTERAARLAHLVELFNRN